MGKLLELLKSDRLWTVVSALSGAIAAVAAMIAVHQAATALRAEREARRSYFTIEAPGIKPLPNSPPYRIQITLQNSGGHPAADLVGKILFVDASTPGKAVYRFDFSVANDVPAGSPTPWYDDSLMLPSDVAPMYVVLALSYRDEILARSYSQVFYMKWDGVRSGTTHPDFVHVSAQERVRIEPAVRGEIAELSQK